MLETFVKNWFGCQPWPRGDRVNTLPYSKNNPIFLKKNPQTCFPQKKTLPSSKKNPPVFHQKIEILFFSQTFWRFWIFERSAALEASERASEPKILGANTRNTEKWNRSLLELVFPIEKWPVPSKFALDLTLESQKYMKLSYKITHFPESFENAKHKHFQRNLGNV